MLGHRIIWVISCWISSILLLGISTQRRAPSNSQPKHSSLTYHYPSPSRSLFLRYWVSPNVPCYALWRGLLITLKKRVSIPTYLSFGSLCRSGLHTLESTVINSSIDMITYYQATCLVATGSPPTDVVSNILMAAGDIFM